MKIFAGRSSLIGDTVMALPLINVLRKMYGLNIDITWPISKKCRQASPLYIDQRGIDKIYITKEEEFLGGAEENSIKNEYDLFIDPTPQHSDLQWYNHRNCVEETILMCGEKYYEVWKDLPKEIQQPRLNPWWRTQSIATCDIMIRPRVAIHTTAGYGKGNNRSPSYSWWKELIILLRQRGFDVIQFGHYTDGTISENVVYNHFSLFEQIQLASECDGYIGTDSGFSWIMGALGIDKQVNLITDWLPGHVNNLLALAPTNWKNEPVNLFAKGGCSNIKHEDVITAIL